MLLSRYQDRQKFAYLIEQPATRFRERVPLGGATPYIYVEMKDIETPRLRHQAEFLPDPGLLSTPKANAHMSCI